LICTPHIVSRAILLTKLTKLGTFHALHYVYTRRYVVSFAIPAGLITVNSSGAITLTAPLNFLFAPQISLLLNVLDGVHTTPTCATCLQPLVITVIQSNQPPVFTNSNQSLVVLENFTITSALTSLTAIDTTYIGDGLTFAIASVSPPSSNGLFRLVNTSATTVDVFLTAPLNFEQQTTHSMVITATDTGNPPNDPSQSTSMTLNLGVINVNDLPPVILSSAFTIFYTRSRVPGPLSVLVVATDSENGNDGLLGFRMEERDDTTVSAGTFFNITSDLADCVTAQGSTTCSAQLATTGDTCGTVTEPNGQLRFNVIAFDHGNPSLDSIPSQVRPFIDIALYVSRFSCSRTAALHCGELAADSLTDDTHFGFTGQRGIDDFDQPTSEVHPYVANQHNSA
jgi:hypothetical protein